MPAAGFFIATPASNSASVDPHTAAIDEEPLEESISETMRMVYGKSSRLGNKGSMARPAKAPCPISRRPGPPLGGASPMARRAGGIRLHLKLLIIVAENP